MFYMRFARYYQYAYYKYYKKEYCIYYQIPLYAVKNHG